MLRLLFKGVYNHGEVIWLETKWSLLWLFRRFIHTAYHEKDTSWAAFDGWVEIMPCAQLIRYCDYRGSVTYRYAMIPQGTLEGQPLIIRLKGWKCEADPIQGKANEAIREAHDKVFYKELEKHLDKEDVRVDDPSTSEGSDSGHSSS